MIPKLFQRFGVGSVSEGAAGYKYKYIFLGPWGWTPLCLCVRQLLSSTGPHSFVLPKRGFVLGCLREENQYMSLYMAGRRRDPGLREPGARVF